MNRDQNLSRRVLLKGLGASVALPWLESAHLWAGEAAVTRTKSPQRFACLFIGDGISPPHWWPNALHGRGDLDRDRPQQPVSGVRTARHVGYAC